MALSLPRNPSDKMTSSTKRRFLAEAVLIVVSILLAFSIDAWWADLGRQQEEREAYRSLIQDFETASTLLERVSVVHDSVLVAAEAILEMTGPAAVAPPADSLAVLLNTIGRIANFAPPLGALDAMLGSGDLRLVQNTDLRASLASFPSQLAEMNRTQGYGADQVFGDLLPFLSRTFPRSRDTRFEADTRALVRSFEFENHVGSRRTNQERALRSAESMEARIDLILQMLRAELGGP
jgi:hypothetical protein